MTAEQKKKARWIGVAAATVMVLVVAYTILSSGFFVGRETKEEAKIVSKVWNDKPPTAAEEKETVRQVWGDKPVQTTPAPITQDLKLPPGVKPGNWTKTINGVKVKVFAPKDVAVWIEDSGPDGKGMGIYFSSKQPIAVSYTSKINGEIYDEEVQKNLRWGITEPGVGFDGFSLMSTRGKISTLEIRVLN